MSRQRVNPLIGSLLEHTAIESGALPDEFEDVTARTGCGQCRAPDKCGYPAHRPGQRDGLPQQIVERFDVSDAALDAGVGLGALCRSFPLGLYLVQNIADEVGSQKLGLIRGRNDFDGLPGGLLQVTVHRRKLAKYVHLIGLVLPQLIEGVPGVVGAFFGWDCLVAHHVAERRRIWSFSVGGDSPWEHFGKFALDSRRQR